MIQGPEFLALWQPMCLASSGDPRFMVISEQWIFYSYPGSGSVSDCQN
jgi:hypothetical protein